MEESNNLYEAYKRQYSSKPFDEGTLENGTKLIDTMKFVCEVCGQTPPEKLHCWPDGPPAGGSDSPQYQGSWEWVGNNKRKGINGMADYQEAIQRPNL